MTHSAKINRHIIIDNRKKDVFTINTIFEETGLPSISRIKECLKRVLELGKNINVPIAEIDGKLHDEMRNLAYDMFCYQKLNIKTFTILGSNELKKLRLQEDDAFSESDSLLISEFLSKNLLDAFAELVSCCYLNGKRLRPQLYVGNFHSRYSGKRHTIFFARRGEDIYVFREKLDNTRLSVYLSNYFSASDQIEAIVKEIHDISGKDDSFAQKLQNITSKIEEFNHDAETRHSLISGAITFLDFLGWKGLWQSKNGADALDQVSNLIENFRNELAQLSSKYYKEAGDIPISSLISISDTIAVFTPETSCAKICDLLKLHAKFAKYVLEKCCTAGFAIRGAISYGQYSVVKNIMIGPGIDECASWHEMGNWIGVHLTPMAQINWEREKESEPCICAYSVPMKSGFKADYCVLWELSEEQFCELATNVKALLPEIAAKYMNTQKFLRECVWKEALTDGKK